MNRPSRKAGQDQVVPADLRKVVEWRFGGCFELPGSGLRELRLKGHSLPFLVRRWWVQEVGA